MKKILNGLKFSVEDEWVEGFKTYQLYVEKIESGSELLWIGSFMSTWDVHCFFDSLPKGKLKK